MSEVGERDPDRYIESQKMVLDYLKHITTLDTGAMVLLTVLLEKFFQQPQWKFLVIAVFSSFVISILALTSALRSHLA